MKKTRMMIDQSAYRDKRSRRFVLFAAAWVALAAASALSQPPRPSATPTTTAVTPATTAARATTAAAPDATNAATDPTLGITFDVVSIKPSNPQSGYYGVRTLPEGDSLSADNFTVDDMVRWAYHLGHRWGEPEHPDVPKWYGTDRYDIRAKVATLDRHGVPHLLGEGLERGAQCRVDLSQVDHLALVEMDLDEVRRQFNVVPLAHPMV